MSIKIIAIGDPHFKDNNTYETNIMHSSIIKLLIKYKNNDNIIDVVIEGDILDKFEAVKEGTFNRVLKFVEDIMKHCRHVYLIIGNHDRPNNNVFLTDEHFFNALKKWKNITVIDKVMIIKIKAENNISEDEEIEAEFVFVPYVPVGKFRQALNTVGLDHPLENPNCNTEQWEKLKTMAGVFSHQEYYGCKIGHLRSSNGDLWPKDAPFNVSGHIHDEEYLQPNLHYTGTPMQHGHTDTGNKTISLYNYEKIDNKWQMGKEEKIDLKIPKKIHLKLTKEELLNFEIPENATQIKIDIAIDTVEYLQLVKNPKIKKLLDAKIKIKPIDTRKKLKKNQLGSIVPIKLTYSKRLNKEICQSDIGVQNEFERIFGPIEKEIEKEEEIKKPKKKNKIIFE